MIIDTKILLAISFLLAVFSCQKTIETDKEQLPWFLAASKVTLIEDYYGGLAGGWRDEIQFIPQEDSVKIVRPYSKMPDGKNSWQAVISMEQFAEIITEIECLIDQHKEDRSPMGNCIFSDQQYFLRRNYTQMRLYAPLSDCQLDVLLSTYLSQHHIDESG